MEIDEGKIADFYRARNVPRACTLCGADKWGAKRHPGLLPAYIDGNVRMDIDNATGEGTMPGLPVIILTCKNCGSVRLIDAEFFSS